MPKYKIYAGLGGGYGGPQFECVEEHDTEDQALQSAYQYACEHFEGQLGCGMDGWEDFIEEAKSEVSIETYEDDDEGYQEALEKIASNLETEARENWTDYYVEEIDNEVEIDEWGEVIEK